MVPDPRVRPLNDHPVNQSGDYVLYWMIANRRATWNFSLDRAIGWCRELGKPLVILEALRVGYRWASDRLHRFVLQGMADKKSQLAKQAVTYYPYVEPEPGSGSGLLAQLAAQAAVVVTDDFPCFFLPSMLRHVSGRLPVLLEAVDGNGLFPMRATDRVFTTAHSFRRFLQKNLADHLLSWPMEKPWSSDSKRPALPAPIKLPRQITDRWPPASDALLSGQGRQWQQLPIDHSVGPASFDGGPRAAGRQLRSFLKDGLSRYADDRNHPDTDASSRLSPYLHFGHCSAHEVFARIVERESWSPARLSPRVSGSREGWWNMSAAAESFLDELITWRELGYNLCWQRDDYDRYESLPEWARLSLEKHQRDPRSHVYDLETFTQARTHDPIWNAAQTQLVREGRMHNYLRMLWGKKILEWTERPRDALEIMIELNNRFAVDGRNPNSYSGIFWVLGRYDRAWGPERPIFGKIRYMSSDNTRRKLKMTQYLEDYGQP